MSVALQILEILLPLLYVVVLGLYGRHFSDGERSSGKLASRSLWGLLSVHIGYTVMRGIAQHAWPMGSKAEFLSLLALSIALVYALTERGEEDTQTGIFFVGIAAPFQAAASLLMEDIGATTHPILLEHPIYGIHVLFTVLGFAALTVGALEAVMYLLLSRQLKSRDLGLFFRRLPPLVTLEDMSRLSTIIGISLLGAGLGLGHFVAIYVLESFNPWDPKIVVMDVAWALYFVGFLVVRLRGVSGGRMGKLCVGAYVSLMLTMILSNVLLESFHSFQP